MKLLFSLNLTRYICEKSPIVLVGSCFKYVISYSLSASLANFATRLTASKSNTHHLLSTQCRRRSPGAVLISALNAARDHSIDRPNDTK